MAKRLPNEPFFMVTNNVRNRLLECKLTAAEWRMWFYLVTLDPFGDSGAKFSPAELMLKCGIKKTAYFKAKAKFQKLGLFDFKDGVTKVINLQGQFSQSANAESQSANAESQSANAESQSSKQALNKGSESPQTIQTIQTPQTGGGVKNFSLDSDLDLVNKKVDDTEQNYSEQATAKKEKLVNNKNSGEDQSSADVVQVTTKRETSQEIYPKKVSHEAVDIPQDLISKLKDLGISLDEQVKRTIADHDISQAYGAIRHVENTWETINNPRSVFLFQLPKQRIQKGPAPISEAFLKWYQGAIADGLVVDYPAKYLPTNYRGEPKVKLTIDPNWAEDWEKVRDNPDDYRQLIDPKLKKELWAKVATMLGRPPKPEPEPTLNTSTLLGVDPERSRRVNDQLSDPILGPELYPKIKHSHHVEFTEEGRPYQATPIADIQYDEDGVPLGEVKS